MPIVVFLTTSDLTRPIRIPASAGRGAERPTMDSTIRCPFVDSVAFLPCRNPRVGQRDHRRKANMNTLAQAEVRRNRLKNNTTRLSPAPGQAICNCWHKRKLAGYPTVLVSRESLRALLPTMDLAGVNTLDLNHSTIDE